MRGALGQPTLARAVTARRPSRAQRARVTRSLQRVAGESDALAVRLVDARGRVAFSSVAGERGGGLAATPDLRAALAGESAAAKQRTGGTTSVGAYVPLRRNAASAPVGVLNTDTPATRSSRRPPGGGRTGTMLLVGWACWCWSPWSGAVLAPRAASARARKRRPRRGTSTR